MNKVKFRWGEETYTLCVTQDDCWLEDGPSDISDRMLKGMDELAMESGMLPPKGLCAGCWKGTYEAIVEDYHIAGETIKDLDLHRCPKCGHTTLPWQSVERVDEILVKHQQQKELK
jgi:DNA-directed RNA polymerase subunit RPC12/RpoP